MGHQHHFLSRLDRVPLPQVEMALALYRDHGLVHYLLAQVKLPDGAERVAISLEHPEEGPFLVVTRDGRFVTCLGAGMKVADLPVVTRGQLDAITGKVGDLRERMQAALALARVKGGTEKLLERIYTAGPGLSREEFIGLSAFQPLLGMKLLSAYFGAVTRLEDMRKRLVKIERPKPALAPLLREYWETFWSVSHLAVLALLDGRTLVDDLPSEIDFGKSPLSWGAVRQGIIAPALRGIWGVAKVGKSQVRTCKEAFEDAQSPLALITSGTGLLALGARHVKLRAEVRKALEAPRDLSRVLYRESLLKLIQACVEAAFDAPEEGARYQRALGAGLAIGLTSGLPAGADFRFQREEDVPEDLAMTLATYSRASFITSGDAVAALLLFVPWVARAEPEQLFLPKAFLRAAMPRWSPASSMELLAPLREHYRVPPPAQPEGPARKGPCPCGSGKKYKRCCGEER